MNYILNYIKSNEFRLQAFIIVAVFLLVLVFFRKKNYYSTLFKTVFIAGIITLLVPMINTLYSEYLVNFKDVSNAIAHQKNLIEFDVLLSIYVILLGFFANTLMKHSDLENTKFVRKLASGSTMAIKIILKSLRFILLLVVLLFVLDLWGVNINGIIAGLGVGGIVIAMGAQDVVANVLGGANVFIDKQYEIGDWISINSAEGIVEDINYRSTKIRSFDSTLDIVPNQIVNKDIVKNLSKRNKRKINFTLGVVYQTKSEDLKNIVSDIYNYLSSRDDVSKDDIIVKFSGFGESSLDISIIYHTYNMTLDSYMNVKEEVNFEIIDIVEKNNSSCAYPTRTVMIEK